MFYLTTHLKRFIDGYMVKDDSDSLRENLLPPLHGLLFPISSKGSFICKSHKQDSTFFFLLSFYFLIFLHQAWIIDWNEK